MSKMNPEVKTKLVAALRSGEYTKGRHVLRSARTGCFCVLGVVCDLYLKEHGMEWTPPPSGSSAFEIKGCDNILPDEIQAWAGFDSEGGNDIVMNGHTTRLWSHNDDGATFEQLADAIEQQL